MLHLQHQFLHPLDHRLPFSSAFRPLAPSAFAPPTKRLKLESELGSPQPQQTTPGGAGSQPPLGSLSSMSSMFSPQTQPQDLAPQSPANSTASRSPTGSVVPSSQATPAPGDEDREAASVTPCSENTERSTPEEGRPYRRKKKFSADPTCCPVCGITVRPQELEQHFLQELDRLYKLSSVSSRPRPRSTMPPQPPDHPHGQILHTPSAADGTPFGRWETYKRIKANRQARIRIKNRKRKADEPACPVCQERLSGSPEELNHHVERCLNKQNGNPDRQLDDEEVDVEGDTETFEEYEWAGQRRVRASSMLLGGFSAAGLATSSSNRSGANGGRSSDATQDEDDVDLVVDGDDQAQFGPSQYSEADVITPRLEGSAREQKEREALREAVISPNGSTSSTQQMQVEVKTEPSPSPSSTSQQQSAELAEEQKASSSTSPHSSGVTESKSDSETPVVDALRGRIRELEAEMRIQPFKCLICMEQYKKPVTSVCCWHVHCEQCWLQTLGAKKLCPQCNMITSPSDLRRIYM